jgi:hypothetical protein
VQNTKLFLVLGDVLLPIVHQLQKLGSTVLVVCLLLHAKFLHLDLVLRHELLPLSSQPLLELLAQFGLHAHELHQLCLQLGDLAGSSPQVFELLLMFQLEPIELASRHGARKLCLQQGDTGSDACKQKPLEAKWQVVGPSRAEELGLPIIFSKYPFRAWY